MSQALTTLSEDEQMFKEAILSFADSEIRPLVEEMDESEQLNKELLPKLFEMGIMGVELPENHGGTGGSFFMSILAVEALATVDPAISVLVDVQNTLVNNVFMNFANKEVQDKYMPMLASNKVGCYCLTEPNSGSDAFALETQAKEDGDDYVLNGSKIFITNAMEAEIFVVFANINPELGYKGITGFVCDKSMPGLSIGKKEKKLGIRASSTCEVIFKDVRVPKKNIVGELGKGYKIAIETLNEGRIGIGAQMVGLAQGALDGAIKYASERSQFGKPIGKFQGIQFQIAEMATKLEAARLMVYNAARLKDAGKPFVKEAAMCKLFSSEAAEEIASLSLEIYGGYGFIKEFPAEKFYRDAKIGKLYEGTSNMQKSTIYKILEKR